MSKQKLRLKPPLITFERVKISLILIIIILSAEIADPRPVTTSPVAKILYFTMVLEVIRQFVNYRLEVSYGAVVRQREWQARWGAFRERFSANSRYRLRRAIYIVLGWLSFGYIIDAFTDRCTGAFQCAILLPQLAIESIPAALQIAFYIAIGMMQLFAMFYAMTKVGFIKIVYPGTILDTFDDVWGQDDAKAKFIEQVKLLEDDEAVAKAGGYMPTGVLAFGPPGTGKTLLAKAAANFSTKPLILIPPGGFASTFVGINFLKVWQLFKIIRKLSLRHGGVVVFFDEIDSLGNRGGGVLGEDRSPPTLLEAFFLILRGVREPWRYVSAPVYDTGPAACAAVPVPASPPAAYWEHRVTGDRYDPADPHQVYIGGSGGMNMGTLEAFLSAMDGMDEPRGLVNKILALLGFKPLPAPKYRYLMIGATNRIDAIDPALLRAGRFGRKIHVDFPKFDGRLKTYEGYLGRVSHELTPEQISWAARNHYRGTGAEIKDIVNEALLITFRSGGENAGTIHFEDMTKAMLWVRHGESRGQFERERNRFSVAVHEASHALVMHHLQRDTMNIWLATVEQHGRAGGFVSPSPIYEDWKALRSDMLNEIQVSLASRVGERLLVGEMSNGHGGDGPHATRIAQQMVRLGHGSTIGFYGPEDRPKGEWQQEVEAILREAEENVTMLLSSRKDQILVVAEMLQERGIVPGDDIHRVIDEMEMARA